jgi:hypothetical protein
MAHSKEVVWVGRRGAREADPRTLGFKRTACGNAGKAALNAVPKISMHAVELFGGVHHSYFSPRILRALHRLPRVVILVGPRGRYFEMFNSRSRAAFYIMAKQRHCTGSRYNLDSAHRGNGRKEDARGKLLSEDKP